MGVFIAGKGIITSIGANTQENFASLIAAKSGIRWRSRGIAGIKGFPQGVD